ncbi:unnamed protein product [Allacma fusca]|uniref:Uncharacterized protein n=1 Tax=Allacma fusca TaxID=39272 RepID=A0A8J2KB69_9HEXA|nr:unnamed protein product [Allacma fusca]
MLSMGNATANRLSVSTRATLLGVRDVKDPFSVASDNAVKEFRDYIVNASPDEINLEECSLLLHATARLLSMQMKFQTERITELAAFVTNTAKVPTENIEDNPDGAEVVKKKRGRKKNENPEENPDVADGNQGESISQDGSTNPVGSSPQEEAMCSAENSSLTNPESVTAPEVTLENEVTHMDDFQNDASENDIPLPQGESLIASVTEPSEVTLSVDTGCNTEATCTDAGASVTSSFDNQESNKPSNISESTTNPDEVGNSSDNPSVQNPNDPENSQGELHPVNTASIIVPNTRSASKRHAKEQGPFEGPPAKRRRPNGLSLPPILSPNEYLDYGVVTEDDDSESELDCEAPMLYPEVDLWNGQFDPSADPDAPIVDHVESNLLAEGFETLVIESSDTQSKENIADTTVLGQSSSTDGVNDKNNSTEVTQSSAEATATVTEGVQGPQTANEASASSDINGTPVNCIAGAGYMELNALTVEDQQEIQNCINQLHYLPFTCELTKVELERSFDNTVEHLEQIFKKYNTVFNRQLLNAATVVCANMVSSFSSRPASGEQAPYKEKEQLSNSREIFSQGSNGMHANTITSLINSEKTILERTREKSFAESRANIQMRLEEMQRLIVPKYIQWPLIAENTPEFFHRVKQFEQKMKKVLADEEKKESFDVNDALPNGIRPHGMMSPVFNSQSSHENGRKWVPLSTVFNHMKKFDRNECARHFYAVLALLSSQNLDMNYDRHYSQESAALMRTKRKFTSHNMSNGDVHTDSDDEFVPVSYTANFSTNLFGVFHESRYQESRISRKIKISCCILCLSHHPKP